MTLTRPPLRIEHDLIGSREVPAVYYGIHTLRAVENFPISGQRLSDAPALVSALAAITTNLSSTLSKVAPARPRI